MFNLNAFAVNQLLTDSTMVYIFVDKFGLLLEISGAKLLMQTENYATAIHENVAPLQDCVGFIDYTKIRCLLDHATVPRSIHE